MTATGSVPAGTRVGRYEIVSLLRQGGMGEVYSAEDRQLGRRVALKILPKHRTGDPERVARFVREVQASATLNHPSIVAVHDAGSDGELHFLAMELIDGVPLSEWMRRRRSIEARVEVMAQVAEGLAKAHDAGILHRDLKPDNIMITADGRAKIVDFGVAKLTERVGERATDRAITGISTPTSRVGTTAYMSPEQVEGKLLDRRTDVFSFGTVLYELLTGANPFAAPQYADTLHNVVHHEPALDRIPPQLRRIVRRCLHKEPSLRYDSLRDAALDLREAIEESEPSSPKRKRGVYAIAAVVMLAIAAGTWFVKREAQPKQSAMMMTRLTHSGNVMTAAISPDGKYLVHAIREGDAQALYVKQIATGTITKIADAAPLYYVNLVVSPDSNYAYYIATTRDEPNVASIYQIPLLGGAPRRIAEDTEFWFSLSPDGTRVVFRRYNALTREMSMAIAAVDGGGEETVLRRKPPDFLDYPVWTHDGKAITFVAGNLRRRERVLSRLTLETREIAPMKSVPNFPAVDGYVWLPDGSGALVTVYEREQPSQIWYVPTGDTTGRKVTSEVSAYSGVTPTADGLSFSAVRTVSDSNIYVMSLDDMKSLRPLTSGVGNWVGGGGVRWLSDREVAFSGPAGGQNAYFTVGIEGGAMPRRLVQSMSMAALVVSPDRKHIAFASDKSGTYEVWVADANGENARQLTHQDRTGYPSFTPDSKSVVYLAFDDSPYAWRAPIDGSSKPVQITNVPTNRPSVSPDGKSLLCRLRSTEPNVPLWRTAIVPMDGKGAPRFFDVPRSGAPPSAQWHPNGHAILFIDNVSGVANIWMQDVDGSAPRQLTFFDTGEIFSFDIASDGRRIAITRGQSTRDAVLIRDFK